MVLVENLNDPACPVMALQLLRLYCPPQQVKVFCRPASDAQVFEYKTGEVAYKSNPNSTYGVETVSKWIRIFSCMVGCKGWKLMLNHAVRGGMATILNISDVSLFFILFILLKLSYIRFLFVITGESVREVCVELL